MTVTIHLTPDLETRLMERAAQTGESVASYIQKLVEREVFGANGGPTASEPRVGRTLAEIVAPVHEEFRRSGMTEEELQDLIEECRQDVWQGKQARKSS